MTDNGGRGFDRALTTAMGIIAAAFAALGGAATVAYVVGYLNRKMYLSVFGAGWVLSELKTTEVLIASFPVLASLVVALGFGFQGVTKGATWARMKIVYFAYSFGIGLLFIDFIWSARLLYEARAVLYAAVTGVLLFVTVALARIGFVTLSERSVTARYAAVNTFALAIISGCVLAPGFMGISEGLSVCGGKLRDLPTVVAPRAGADRLALLATSSERVYCMKWRESGDIQVFPIAWEAVVAITNKRR